ncbi:MAG: hypothetical protein KGJ11_04725, partial [Candidatus Omnitrophica bacterium]|nr:hypothetical protein [Candidatus Omnitrophota bacterium]
NTNFLFFVFYTAAITFATQMASPYTSVYMLRDLNFSYWSYMCVNFASMFTGLLSFPIWGRHADILGNLKVLKLTGWLIPWTPILYMFSHTPWQLSVVEVFNGFIWAGFNLCATNFIYDAAPPHKRVQYICYSNIVNGIALFSGASIGGVLGSHLPLVDGSRLFFLFMISSFFRLMSQWLIFPQVHEVRVAYRKVHSYTLFFSVLGIRPIFGRDVESPTLSRPFSHRFKMFFRAALRPR